MTHNDKQKMMLCYGKMCMKAKSNITKIDAKVKQYPGTMDGNYFDVDIGELIDFSHIFGWTQSFFSGMALLAAEHTGDFEVVKTCNDFYAVYHKKVHDTPKDTMHDLGFLYTLYSTMLYSLTGAEKMRELSIKAAEVLAHRFIPNGAYIRAWGRMDDTIPSYVSETLAKDQFFQKSKGLAIIDCMMNLPLLFFASEQTSDPFYANIAIAHADTTIKYFIRQDGSVCHAYRFDMQTGEPVGEFNGCGYALGSHWARGTAWAAYGFALAYKYTKLERYKTAFEKIANAYLKALGEDIVPVWDFKLPKDEPARNGGVEKVWPHWDVTNPENKKYNKDSSAGAIIGCAFLTMYELTSEQSYITYAEKLASELCENYIDLDENVHGLLKRQNGVNGYGCYGDYFALELIAHICGTTKWCW